MSGPIDQSGNYINPRLFPLFPPLGTNARREKLAKIPLCPASMDQVTVQYFIIIWKESNRRASRQYLLHLHMTLLDGKLLMGETKYLIGGERGVFGENWARQIFFPRLVQGILSFAKY